MIIFTKIITIFSLPIKMPIEICYLGVCPIDEERIISDEWSWRSWCVRIICVSLQTISRVGWVAQLDRAIAF